MSARGPWVYGARMRTPHILLVSLALALAAPGIASATTPVAGQSVIYRYDSTHSYVAIVVFVVGAGEADLVILNAASLGYTFNFGPSSRYDWPATYLADVTEGSGDNRWQVNPNIGLGATGPAGSTGATGATGSTGSIGATGPGALVTGSSTPTLTLNGSAVQFDTAHDTEYMANVKIITTLSLTGGTAGHVDLVCDASNPPTTTVETASVENTGTLTVGLALQTSNSMVLRWRVPAGQRCKLTTTNDTGTPTFSIVRQSLQTLGS